MQHLAFKSARPASRLTSRLAFLGLAALVLLAGATPLRASESFAGATSVKDIVLPRDGTELARLIGACEAAYEEVHRDPVLYRSCYAYQTGLVVAWRFYVDFLKTQLPENARAGLKQPFCLGAARDSEINQAILDFLATYPEASDLPAPAVALGAFMETFPCSDG